MKQLVVPIQTPRLTITRFTLDMADSVRRLSVDDEVKHFLPDEVFPTEAAAAKALCKLIAYYDNMDGPLVYPVLHEGTHIGHVEAVPLAEGWEIGYLLGRSARGRGYATEAVRAFVPAVMDALDLAEIQGICHGGNTPSCRVLERCDFTPTYDGFGLYQGEFCHIKRYVYRRNKD